MAEVLFPDGTPQGWHYWNRLDGGAAMDLTREQFAEHESIQKPRVVPRPPQVPRRGAEQYLRRRSRVEHRLGSPFHRS